jgi:hypothetical protein
MFLNKREELTDFEKQIMKEAEARTMFKSAEDWFVRLICWNTFGAEPAALSGPTGASVGVDHPTELGREFRDVRGSQQRR